MKKTVSKAATKRNAKTSIQVTEAGLRFTVSSIRKDRSREWDGKAMVARLEIENGDFVWLRLPLRLDAPYYNDTLAFLRAVGEALPLTPDMNLARPPRPDWQSMRERCGRISIDGDRLSLLIPATDGSAMPFIVARDCITRVKATCNKPEVPLSRKEIISKLKDQIEAEERAGRTHFVLVGFDAFNFARLKMASTYEEADSIAEWIRDAVAGENGSVRAVEEWVEDKATDAVRKAYCDKAGMPDNHFCRRLRVGNYARHLELMQQLKVNG